MCVCVCVLAYVKAKVKYNNIRVLKVIIYSVEHKYETIGISTFIKLTKYNFAFHCYILRIGQGVNLRIRRYMIIANLHNRMVPILMCIVVQVGRYDFKRILTVHLVS